MANDAKATTQRKVTNEARARIKTYFELADKIADVDLQQRDLQKQREDLRIQKDALTFDKEFRVGLGLSPDYDDTVYIRLEGQLYRFVADSRSGGVLGSRVEVVGDEA